MELSLSPDEITVLHNNVSLSVSSVIFVANLYGESDDERPSSKFGGGDS
jgi:hypothetical protein